MPATTDKHSDLRRANRRNSLPAAYPRLVMEIVADRGIDPLLTLEGTRLSPALLDTPDFRVAADEAARIVFNAFRLTGDRGLGLEFGLRTKPTTHGYLGYAAMSCGTLREAMELAVRYLHIRQRDFSARLSDADGMAVVSFSDNHDPGPLRVFFLECFTIGLLHITGFLLGDSKLEGELWFDWPEPDYFAPYRERLWMVKFNQPTVQIRFPLDYLDRALVMADPIAVKQAVAQCEREMAMSGPGPENLLQRVRDELRPGSDGYPNLATVASCLFMSERSLKRKLAERGTGFKQLLDEVRYKDALKLLENPDLDISQICTALGYSDPPSFTRAFKRWSGHTPSEIRGSYSSQ